MRIIELLENEYPDELIAQYTERAEAERQAGGSIEIDAMLPSISVKLSDGSEYFFQEHEADDILASVPDGFDPEDFILATAQNW